MTDPADEFHLTQLTLELLPVTRAQIQKETNREPSVSKVYELTLNGCQQIQRQPQTAPLHSLEWPTTPWQCIHIDDAGLFMDRMFLIAVDAHSKWP